MSPTEHQRWSRLRQLLVDLKPADQSEPTPNLLEEPPVTPGETPAAAEVQEPALSFKDIPIEATATLSQVDATGGPALEGIVLNQGDTEEPQAQAELAQPQEVEAKASPPLEEIVLAQEAPEKPPSEAECGLPQEVESSDENPSAETLLSEALVTKTETTPTRQSLDWNCSTRAFFESLPYEGERDYQREIPSQNWLGVPTSHFLENLVPWYGLKDRHPDANLRQLVDLATQDAMKRAAQLQRLQTEEVTANAGHFFRNLNWQGVQKP